MSKQDELYTQIRAEIARARTSMEHIVKHAYDLKVLVDSYQNALDQEREEAHNHRWEGGGNY